MDGTDVVLVGKENEMNAAQRKAVKSIEGQPGIEAKEVAGLGVVLVTRSHDASSAEVTTVNSDGTRGWMHVRIDAGASGRFPRPQSVGVSGTTLNPDAAIAYAALINYAVQAVLPTLVKETR